MAKSAKRITGGGLWQDPANRSPGLYFTVVGDGQFFIRHRTVLTSCSGKYNPRWITLINEQSAKGKIIMLDSGVFTLMAKYLAEQGLQRITAQGEGAKVTDYPDYENHLLDYVRVVKEVEPAIWGYIEIDLGQWDQKTAIRKRLE